MNFLAKGVAAPLRKTALFATVSGFGLAAAHGAGAQSIQVWSGYPELAPFYEHVAEGMAEQYPDLEVTVEAINLRDHERRVALGLTSGEAADGHRARRRARQPLSCCGTAESGSRGGERVRHESRELQPVLRRRRHLGR